MYKEIGAFDAKAKLSELLRQIKLGQRYTITVRGRPIADLVPSESSSQSQVQMAIMQMREMVKIRGVSKELIRSWIAEGRK